MRYDTGGPAPYGYRRGGPNGTFEPDPDEQLVISAARGYRAWGKSLRTIAAYLAEAGYHARNDRVFQATQIKRMLADDRT